MGDLSIFCQNIGTLTRDTVPLSSCLSENGPPEEHPQLTQQALKSPDLLELRIKAAPDLGAQLIHPPHLAREYIAIYRNQSRLLCRWKFPNAK
jgi:hypothetical protein